MTIGKEPSAEKIIRLSLRDFALPSPRVGSIDTHSGYGRSALDGIEIHQAVQAQRAEEFQEYEAEVPTTMRFIRGGYTFQVDGRIDGIFRRDPVKIEEIKSSFNIHELSRVLRERGVEHPYILQLRTYGYFHWKKEGGDLPELSLHLVSSRNRQDLDLDFALDVAGYESWLERRLAELVDEAERIERRVARRRKIAEAFPFPFAKPRRGQTELVAKITEGLAAKERMLIQAPTGLGKTMGVLYPSLRESLARGQRVVYVTPKNSQHAVAEDAAERFQAQGSAVKSLTITAKSKICFKAEALCNPTYCEYAKDHYTKVAEGKVLEQLAKKKKLTSRVFRKIAEEHQVCPFEIQLDASAEADVVICDYNYVFAPTSAFGRLPKISFASEGNPNLVIDEAHNLPARAMGYYSPALSSFVLELMRGDLRALPKKFATESERLLDSCLGVLVNLRPEGESKPMPIALPLGPFAEQDGELRGFLSKYLESDVEIEAKDPVLRLCFYWSQFTDILEQISESRAPEFFTTFHPDRTGGVVKITCCDASKLIRENYDAYENVVGFSATLKPFDYYAKLSGLDSPALRIEEFASPFEAAKRKILVIPQISTKYSERARNYPRIADAMERIIRLKSGNYLAFFPSFEFMDQVRQVFRPPSGFRVLHQTRQMKNSEVEDILAELRSPLEPTLLFAVQGGVFSEGVDYPGKMVIGAFVVGPPLPGFDLERETMRKYYQEHYREGFEYAYTYPAMAKAVQSAGRVIRSEEDEGVIVLMDNRFLDRTYTKTMPADWFSESAHELVSGRILGDVSDFWDARSEKN